jgi:Tol biopolymer transport system component
MRPDGSDVHPIYACTGDLCAQIMQPAWSPDGSRIAIAPWVEWRPQLVVVTPAGGRRVIRTCAGSDCVTPSDAVWAPDGRRLAFFSSARDSDAYVIDADGNGMHRVGLHAGCCLAWLGR